MILNYFCFYHIIRIRGPFSGSTSEILGRFGGVRAPARLSGVPSSEPQEAEGCDWIGIVAPPGILSTLVPHPTGGFRATSNTPNREKTINTFSMDRRHGSVA